MSPGREFLHPSRALLVQPRRLQITETQIIRDSEGPLRPNGGSATIVIVAGAGIVLVEIRGVVTP